MKTQEVRINFAPLSIPVRSELESLLTTLQPTLEFSVSVWDAERADLIFFDQAELLNKFGCGTFEQRTIYLQGFEDASIAIPHADTILRFPLSPAILLEAINRFGRALHGRSNSQAAGVGARCSADALLQQLLCLVLDRSKANLAMARHELKSFEKSLDFA